MAEWQQNVKTVMFYSGFSLIKRSAKQRKETDSRLLQGHDTRSGEDIAMWRYCHIQVEVLPHVVMASPQSGRGVTT